MEINVYRLNSILNDNKKDIIKDGDSFISSINDELFEDDLILKENAVKPIFNVVFVETGGSETKFLKIMKKLANPIILLSHNKYNSLAAAFEIKSYLESNNKEVILLNGDEKEIGIFLKRYSHLVLTALKVKNSNLGVIGKPSDWLIASKVKYHEVKQKYGINLIDISMEELDLEIVKKEYPDFPLLEKLKQKISDKETLDMALYIYGALLRLIEKYHLQGLTIRCFDLLNKYKNTSCLALALLNSQGIISSCEGDIPSLITMYLLHTLTEQPTFQCNPSIINYEKFTMLVAHCTAPLNMISNISYPSHFESNLGIGIKGEFKKTAITVCKIYPSLSGAFAFESEIIDNPNLPGYCRSQINIKVNDDGLLNMLKNPFGNHLIIVYGTYQNEFLSFLEYLDSTQK